MNSVLAQRTVYETAILTTSSEMFLFGPIRYGVRKGSATLQFAKNPQRDRSAVGQIQLEDSSLAQHVMLLPEKNLPGIFFGLYFQECYLKTLVLIFSLTTRPVPEVQVSVPQNYQQQQLKQPHIIIVICTCLRQSLLVIDFELLGNRMIAES